MMRTCELFCGTKSFSKVMDKHNHSTFTIDNDYLFYPDRCIDISILNSSILEFYDILWASPPCQAFSVASIGHNWTGGKRAYIPKSENALIGLKLLEKTIKIIAESKPMFWFIENPRGVMRKVIEPYLKHYGLKFRRVTVCYCQYGDNRMKPTDIWTNLEGWDGKMCKNGNPDHESAPRGAKTGTQGLKGAMERGVIPPALFEEILRVIEVR